MIMLFPLPAPSGFAASGPVTPLVPPPQQYAVNGVLLADQPVVATAPALLGRCIPRGSTLSLSFANPGATTRSALADGSQVALTFILTAGERVTGRVQLASSLVASISSGTPIYVPRLFSGTILFSESGGSGGTPPPFVPRLFSGTIISPPSSGGGGSVSMLLVSVTLLSDLFLSS